MVFSELKGVREHFLFGRAVVPRLASEQLSLPVQFPQLTSKSLPNNSIAMADNVQKNMERMVPEFEEMQTSGLFSAVREGETKSSTFRDTEELTELELASRRKK